MTPFSLLRTSSGPVRSRLLRDLVLLVLLTVGLLVAINILLINLIKEDVAENRIEAATALVRDEVRGLMVPVEQQLLIIRDGLAAAGLTPADEGALNQRFSPILAHMGQIAGAIDASADGAEYFLERDGDGWMTQLRDPETVQTVRITRRDAELRPLETLEETSDYDPRTRPWFTAAADRPGTLLWTRPYVFESTQVPGLTASVGWMQPGQLRVTALDVTIQTIVESIERHAIAAEGRGFLFSGAGGVYVPEDSAGPADAEQASGFFSGHLTPGGTLVFDAVSAWNLADRPAHDLIRFTSSGVQWWGGFRPLTEDLSGGWAGVVLPVSETLAILRSRWHIVALTVLGILMASLGMTTLVVRKYHRQLRDMPKLSIDRRRAEDDLRELIATGESTHLEFKSTMRMNLHSKVTGREIEMAWLKAVAAFLNSEGGILLLGVSDDGTVLGLEADKFENEDKCRLHFKNLLNHHIGAEYARFVRFDLYDLDGLRVGAVECDRADTPAFLRDDKGRELFIIRNGPSNIDLPISRALKYIRGRF
ncbi:RNA-binding domain-containing protein [Thiocapsa marina]|uniref:AAA-4 family protein n=1 Tax=Thiocapsa marina 5811 TaxID=768671 RepID=F9UBV2_9GAMM|nr:RNA-binding domain-containing protein [Thiocapsa marina]EGV18420.1 AAA-4 family protein [Thiocapsa marina 5811]